MLSVPKLMLSLVTIVKRAWENLDFLFLIPGIFSNIHGSMRCPDNSRHVMLFGVPMLVKKARVSGQEED